VPAGIRILPGEEGCLMTSINISSTTMLGNKRMNPSGMEIEEFGFSFIRLLKNDNLESPLFAFAVLASPRLGAAGVYGTFFINLCTKPLAKPAFSDIS